MEKEIKPNPIKKKICVILSSYNGEMYIEQQIKSILNQSSVRIFLLVRDDGSSDKTKIILDKFLDKYDNIQVFYGNNVGINNSFFIASKLAKEHYPFCDYYAFSDQDDFWLPNKLASALNKINHFNPDKPNLYFSNLTISNSQLKPLTLLYSPNFKVNKFSYFSKIFTYGCTVVFNKSTLELFCKSYNNSYFHDHWITLVARFLGNIYYDSNSYILYRQHSKNASGKVRKNLKKALYYFYKLLHFRTYLTPYFSNLLATFYKEYGILINEKYAVKFFLLVINYKNDLGSKVKLLLNNRINSGILSFEIARRIRILLNRL